MHEIGHQFGLKYSFFGGHIDKHVDHLNHAGSDNCVMSYNSDDEDGICEFCTECIYKVRDASDPFGTGE